MQTIRLPYRLSDLDPEKLNLRIHAGEIRLDWSDVESDISPTYLVHLFAGMNLINSIDAIGGDTIPESLIPTIQAAFAYVEAQATPTTLQADKKAHEAPALWLPEILPSPSLEERIEDESIPETPQSLATPARPLLEAPSAAQMREELEAMVLRDLLGPASGKDEEINEARVHDRYLVGMLAPSKTQTIPEELDTLADAETGGSDEGTEDEDTAQKATFSPASLGMSFSVDGKTTELLVTLQWHLFEGRGGEAHHETQKALQPHFFSSSIRG